MADTWLTIEQAAVALGLSVRTVNRHIVAGKIQSRLNDGRREVLVDMPEELSDGATDGPSDPIGAAINAASAASPFAAQRLTIDSQGKTATADYARQASDFARQASDRVRQASEATVQSVDQPPAFDSGTVLALADNAAEKAELAISAYQALARSTDAQFRHVRRSARLAWSSVAVMAAAVAVAVGWTTHYLTKAQVEGTHLQERVRQTSVETDRVSAERDGLRSQLAAAREQAARAEGQVTAMADARVPEGVVREGVSDEQSDAAATQPTTRPTSLMERLTSLFNEKGG
jgi:hypothetical protein